MPPLSVSVTPVRSGGWVDNTRGGDFIRWIGKNKHRMAVADGLPQLYRRLWRFCLVLTTNRSAADDLAQATCERALLQADKFKLGSDLDRWIFTMARRLWLNDIRSAKLRQGQGLVVIEDEDIIDPKPGVEVNILAREVLDIVQALPDGQRLAVFLVYLEGHSYRDAANFLEIPIGTVMSRLSAARKTISGRVEGARIDE